MLNNCYFVSYHLYASHFKPFSTEPILTIGSTECITWPDNWTTLTADGSPAAQFEHTILITRTGAEILTKC
jgi:methionyl aminopeptidase